jgi:hypothetical protein
MGMHGPAEVDEHMKRWLFNILLASSLLLCLASAILWGRSYFVGEVAQCYRMTTLDAMNDDCENYLLSSGNGGVALGWGMHRFRTSTAEEMTQLRKEKLGYVYDGRFHASWASFASPLRYAGPTSDPEHYALGFGFEYGSSGPRRGWRVKFPWALPCAAAAVYPVVVFWRRRRAAKVRNAGCCSHCGYDLRASKERCPECGTPISVQMRFCA